MEDTKPLILVGNVPLPTPSSYRTNTSTIVDSRRNVNGVMIGQTVRESILNVDLAWNYLTAREWSGILKLFTGQRTISVERIFDHHTGEWINVEDIENFEDKISLNGSFLNNVFIYNPETQDYDLKRMYVSDRQSRMYTVDKDGKPKDFLECTLNLMEV